MCTYNQFAKVSIYSWCFFCNVKQCNILTFDPALITRNFSDPFKGLYLTPHTRSSTVHKLTYTDFDIFNVTIIISKIQCSPKIC